MFFNFFFFLIIDFLYLLWNRALKIGRGSVARTWTETGKSFLLSLSRKATCVGAAFLGNESILSAFIFWFSCDNQYDYVRVGKVALSHNEGLFVC